VCSHRAAIVDPKELGALFHATATYQGAPETVAALELAALTFVRLGELRAAEWREIDFENAVWSSPSERMKMRRPHKVPLAPRALAILTQLKNITGLGKFLFPSVRSPSRCMSENTINAALRRLGFTKEENDRPRLPLGGLFPLERKRPLARRCDRKTTGACRRR
jgi:integrase